MGAANSSDREKELNKREKQLDKREEELDKRKIELDKLEKKLEARTGEKTPLQNKGQASDSNFCSCFYKKTDPSNANSQEVSVQVAVPDSCCAPNSMCLKLICCI